MVAMTCYGIEGECYELAAGLGATWLVLPRGTVDEIFITAPEGTAFAATNTKAVTIKTNRHAANVEAELLRQLGTLKEVLMLGVIPIAQHAELVDLGGFEPVKASHR